MKQETLEEVAEKLRVKWEIDNTKDFIKGYKLAQERMYSEEEVIALLHKRMIYTFGDDYQETITLKWFEQFKKKQDE